MTVPPKIIKYSCFSEVCLHKILTAVVFSVVHSRFNFKCYHVTVTYKLTFLGSTSHITYDFTIYFLALHIRIFYFINYL